MRAPLDIHELVNSYRARGEAFALATVVRTVSVTAAKAGAKAVISADGAFSGGWIGGGCARGAVLRAARDALADGAPRLISVQPEDLLEAHHVKAGETHEGVLYARNMCPSEGAIDVFVEPVLPRPYLTILGASPVAVALADLGRRMGFQVIVAAPARDHAAFGETDRLIDGFSVPTDGPERGYVVVSTQGSGDSAALKAALLTPARYLGFVGSRKKAAALKSELVGDGTDASEVERIRAPAGLDIGAVTPDEIAFSIVAELIEHHRRRQNRTIK
jgi:xanthine dehydrogenase accessory factor